MKSNKSINRRTRNNRLSLSRKTKRSDAKNVLKRLIKSQKGGGNNVVSIVEYDKTNAETALTDQPDGTWLIRKSSMKSNNNNSINLVLTIKTGNTFKHILFTKDIKLNNVTIKLTIEENKDKNYKKVLIFNFKNIEEMIKHFKDNIIYSNDKTLNINLGLGNEYDVNTKYETIISVPLVPPSY